MPCRGGYDKVKGMIGVDRRRFKGKSLAVPRGRDPVTIPQEGQSLVEKGSIWPEW